MAGVLEGVRVMEMGQVVAIPAAGALMADWGAEVIKVEPLTGESERGLIRSTGVQRTMEFPGGVVHWGVELLNRNKKGYAVNLKTEAGKKITSELIKTTDIFITNYEVNSLKKLGADYKSLSQVNPALVYGLLTGYGTVGPDKDARGFDMAAAWARSGLQHLVNAEGLPPAWCPSGLMDRVSAGHLVAGTLGALIHRMKTGKGQNVEISLFNMGVWSVSWFIQAALMGLQAPHPPARTEAHSPLWNSYQTKDGRWFQLVLMQGDVEWGSLTKAMNSPEIENDPRFETQDLREDNNVELIKRMDAVFATRDMDEWEKIFSEHNVIFGRTQTPNEVANDPQALANDFFVDVPHPVIGSIKLVNSPIKFEPDAVIMKNSAPEIGQHTEELLLELGYSWEDIASFKEQEAIL